MTKRLFSSPDNIPSINSLSLSQSLNFTSGATSTLQVPNSTNLNQGIMSFSLSCMRNLSNYKVASILMEKHDATTGYRFSIVVTTGYLSLMINDTLYTSSIDPKIDNNTEHRFTVTVSVGASNTTVTFYVDQTQLGTAQVQANETTTDNTVSLYLMGSSSVRTSGIDGEDLVYNRCLSLSDIIYLCENGVLFLDKWGSQTARYTANWSGGADGWNVYEGVSISSGVMTFSPDADKGWCTKLISPFYIVPYLSYVKIVYTIDTNDSNTSLCHIYNGWVGASIIYELIAVPSTVGTHTLYLQCTGTGTRANIGFLTIAPITTGSIVISACSITQLGCVLALESPSIQPAPGQWLDSSTNKLHALQPATGSSLTQPKSTFEIRGTNSWAASHEPQSINSSTDDSRAILPPNCYIDSIIGVITGADVEDIVIGDGADADRWVAITTGLAAGTVSFTIVNHISDGTNYEIVIDPDADCTMTIAWTIRGRII